MLVLASEVRSGAVRCSEVVGTNFCAGVTQLVECQPSKLNVAGSTPVTRFGRKSKLRNDLRNLKMTF